jgi:hypothetical protein
VIQAQAMTYHQLVDRIVNDGIAEVREAYADPENHHKRDGAIEGFEACRGKAPSEIVELWRTAEDQAHQIAREDRSASRDAKDYWRQRYKTLQIEFALNVISAALGQSLLSHLPTARGALKYAAIVGVRDASLEPA